MKKTFIFLIFISVCVIHAQTDDKETLKLLNQKIKTAFRNNKLDDALKYGREALDLNVKIFGKDSKDTAESYTTLGIILKEKLKYDDSILNFQNAVEIYGKNPTDNRKDIALVFNLLMYDYYFSGNMADAEKSGLESLKITEGVYGKESKEAYTSNLAMGELYGRIKNRRKADEYYLKTYALAINIFGKENSEIEKIDDSRACTIFGRNFDTHTDELEGYIEAERNLFGYEEGTVVNGKAIKLVKPAFPYDMREIAKIKKISEKVIGKVTIDESGKIVKANAICGANSFRSNARDAALDSKFEPTLKDGVPLKVKGYIVYNFVPR